MLFATAGQGILLVWMMGAGAVTVVWYALICLLRRLIQAGFVLTLLTDLLFGLGMAGIFLFFLFEGSRGAFRPFVLLGALLGGALFYVGLARPSVRILSAIRTKYIKIMTSLRKKSLFNVIFK